VTLLDDPIQVVLPATHRAAAAPALELADLSGEAWIDSTNLSSCHPFLRRACNAAGFEPRVAAETNDHRSLHHLVASGQGLALIPLLSQLDLPASLVARSIRTNPPKRRIHAAYRSDSSGDTRVRRLLERLDAAAKSRPAALDLVRAGS
jgi:DNA-binding transcriptional LysR family regulator